jgi:ferric-dicitrate binding protein FerR (iron transport regulator)
MLTFWGVVTAVTFYGGLPTVGGLWMFERWRSRRRNRSGECASCGTAWTSTGSDDPYLIHGRLVCEACAEKARRRMPWHFGILGLAAGVAATGVALAEGGLATIILLPIGTTVAMTLGAVQLMKLANRGAQRRIAAGEFPDMEALMRGGGEDSKKGAPQALTE